MANCFTLTRKGESEPAKLQDVDDEMRIEFGEEPDEKYWIWHWHDTMSLGLALGLSWAQLREQWTPEADEDEDEIEFCRRMRAVIDWLDEHYVLNAWAER